jgi:hypothetical protein
VRPAVRVAVEQGSAAIPPPADGSATGPRADDGRRGARRRRGREQDIDARCPKVSVLLRADKNAEIVRLPLSLISLFVGRRYTLASGKRTFDVRWSKAGRDALLAEQLHDPVLLHHDGARGYWMFQDCIYWEGEDLEAQDVKALVLQRTRKRERQLATAHSLMHAEQQGQFVRTPVPLDVRRAVFERDGGRCVECGGNFDLQYDHVIPLSLGGATAVANLQLLCGECNRCKGANL